MEKDIGNFVTIPYKEEGPEIVVNGLTLPEMKEIILSLDKSDPYHTHFMRVFSDGSYDIAKCGDERDITILSGTGAKIE